MLNKTNKYAAFSKINHIYYANTDYFLQTEDNIRSIIENNVKQDGVFFSVVGGMACLNYIRFLNPNYTVFFDINLWAVQFAKLIINIIRISHTPTEFIERIFCRRLQSNLHFYNQKSFLEQSVEKDIYLDNLDRISRDVFAVYNFFYKNALLNPLNVKNSDYCQQLFPCWRKEYQIPVGYLFNRTTNTFFFGQGWLSNTFTFLQTRSSLQNVSFIHSGIEDIDFSSADYAYISNIDQFFGPNRWASFLSFYFLQNIRILFISTNGIFPVNLCIYPYIPTLPKRIVRLIKGNFLSNYLYYINKIIRKIVYFMHDPHRLWFSPSKAALIRIKRFIFGRVLEITTRKCWGFISLPCRYELHYQEITDDKLNGYSVIILHNLMGEGVKRDEFTHILAKSKEFVRRLVVLEHNNASKDWSKKNPYTSEDELRSIFRSENLDIVHFSFSPGYKDDQRNLLFVVENEVP